MQAWFKICVCKRSCQDEISAYTESTAQSWRQQSNESLQLNNRLMQAQNLISALEQAMQPR